MKTLEKTIQDFMTLLEPNWKQNPDMIETPTRIAKMYQHFFRNEDIEEHIKKKFPTTNNQMVIVKNIEAIGMCPHHFVPIIYNVDIGYIPDGWAIGLSKLARIAVGLASYPKLQENYTDEIAKTIEENLNPIGVMVVVDGVHGCMRCRGAQQVKSSTTTSAILGSFKTSPEARAEFLNLIAL